MKLAREPRVTLDVQIGTHKFRLSGPAAFVHEQFKLFLAAITPPTITGAAP